MPGATEAENLRKQGAALARRFAVVEGKTAAVLRRTAEQTRNPETAERRRRLATEAEQEQARALERAERMDPSGEADESTDHYN